MVIKAFGYKYEICLELLMENYYNLLFPPFTLIFMNSLKQDDSSLDEQFSSRGQLGVTAALKRVTRCHKPYSTTCQKCKVETVAQSRLSHLLIPKGIREDIARTSQRLPESYGKDVIVMIAYNPTHGVSRASIMTFNISTELFEEIQLPEFLAKDLSFPIAMNVVGKSLGVIYSTSLNVYRYGETVASAKKWDMNMIMESKDGDISIHNYNVGYYVYAFNICKKDNLDCKTNINKYQESLA
ncbi:hypothetical protein OSB04_012596 [Centaurea solstitialis]|uniref:Uncharacterized protein n=1 Tax=Centaurea solstitialis TaxID=347529 RepID=A0AA38TUQ3_9ASTR|nr:hypothetical protein OSB04_012596 [Centaurea solstitialis]